ncbi:MAG: helix-turn-helix transcriptional regulator [Cyanobacteria bacterium P01_F01_bin.4]
MPQLTSLLEPNAWLDPTRASAGLDSIGFDTVDRFRKRSGFSQINIETLLDGILLLTPTGDVLRANQPAYRICSQLLTNPSQSLPKVVWRLCQTLTAQPEAISNLAETEISTAQFPKLYLRAQWITLEAVDHPCLLVVLEDRHAANQRLAASEANQYGLTPREAEVWRLRRAERSNKEIAQTLYISINTVKKHIKSILAKREVELGWG